MFSVSATSKLCICRLCPRVCLTWALARQSPWRPFLRRDSPGARGPFWVGGSGRVKPPGPRLLYTRLCPLPRQEQGDPSAETGWETDAGARSQLGGVAAAPHEVRGLPSRPRKCTGSRRVTPEAGGPVSSSAAASLSSSPLAATDPWFSNWVIMRPLPAPPRGHSCVLRPFHGPQLGLGCCYAACRMAWHAVARVPRAEAEDSAGVGGVCYGGLREPHPC